LQLREVPLFAIGPLAATIVALRDAWLAGVIVIGIAWIWRVEIKIIGMSPLRFSYCDAGVVVLRPAGMVVETKRINA
jgi:hypothetical protein